MEEEQKLESEQLISHNPVLQNKRSYFIWFVKTKDATLYRKVFDSTKFPIYLYNIDNKLFH
jgi:hypothetical protein